MDNDMIQLPDCNSEAYKKALNGEETQTQKQPGEVSDDMANEMMNGLFPPQEEGDPETIDLGQMQMKIPQMISEVKTFLDLSTGAQLVAIVSTETNKVVMLKGSTILPIMTNAGLRGMQVEIDFPVNENSDLALMEQVKMAFDSYEVLAEEAAEKKKKELEDQSRIVGANGLPFDPKGGPKGPPFAMK